MFADRIAKFTRELYLPTGEISFNSGYTPEDMLQILLKTLQEFTKILKQQGAMFLPLGNMPVTTLDVQNMQSSYYGYLFNERDGKGIARFRGQALQLHKGIEDKDLAIYTFNKIRHLLPYFLVLSANSPIHNNVYSGNVSERTITKASWKMVGIPGSIDEHFFQDLQL
jgi:gamma-glutamyl:cysteine ligase YbdK (ATP-grasp superfamily)